MATLEREFRYYKDHQDELVKQYDGKFLAIKGEEVVGVYDTELEAYTDAKRNHPAGTFLIQHCLPGEAYNIGGATVISVGEFLDLLVKRAYVPIKTRQDPQLIRPADVTLQIPCVDKFRRATGWKPQYDFNDSLKHLLKHWRKEAARNGAQA